MKETTFKDAFPHINPANKYQIINDIALRALTLGKQLMNYALQSCCVSPSLLTLPSFYFYTEWKSWLFRCCYACHCLLQPQSTSLWSLTLWLTASVWALSPSSCLQMKFQTQHFHALITREKGFGCKGCSFHRIIAELIWQCGNFTCCNDISSISIYRMKSEGENFNLRQAGPDGLSIDMLDKAPTFPRFSPEFQDWVDEWQTGGLKEGESHCGR